MPCLTWPAPQRALKPKCHAQVIRSFSYKSQAASCPQSMIWKESYWANRAEQARATVESIRNPECRRIVREIAVSFDRLAKLTGDFKSSAGTSTTLPRSEAVTRHRASPIGTKAHGAIDWGVVSGSLLLGGGVQIGAGNESAASHRRRPLGG